MDLRRSVLWVVFTMSMIFLYNAWLRYNGETDLFGTPPAHPAQVASAPTSAVPQAAPSAATLPSAAGAATGAPLAAPAGAAWCAILVKLPVTTPSTLARR